MRKKITIVVAIMCLTFSSVNAQLKSLKMRYGKKEIPALGVGEMVPEFTIPKVINSAKRSFMMSEFRDQLLIIDFWYTSCAGCIEAMPKMNELQKRFGNRIKVLPATYEPEAIIAPFWKNNKYTRGLALPTVVDDRMLLSYFEFVAAPHEVWVYKGKVIAITDADYVNAANIERVLSGEKIDWPVKNDFPIFDGRTQHLFTPDTAKLEIKGSRRRYVGISGYKPNLSTFQLNDVSRGIVRNKETMTIRYFNVNMPIFNFYLTTWTLTGLTRNLVKPGKIGISPNEIIWEVAGRSKYIHDKDLGNREGWLIKNGICFESQQIDTGQNDKQIYQSVIRDLDRLLGLNVRWEKRKEKVLVLVKTTIVDKLKNRNPSPKDPEGNVLIDRYSRIGNVHKVRDGSLYELTSRMNGVEGNPYVFDETGYKENVDMDLVFSSWSDIVGIKKALAPYGLELREEERLVDKFVFSEVDGGLLADVEMEKFAGARRESQKAMANPSEAENNAFLEANKKKPGVMVLPSGVQYKILKRGTGERPTLSDTVRFHYSGSLVNGKIFDSSYERGVATVRPLSGLIEGWQQAMPLMEVGSKWEIYVPSALAYGSHTGQGKFPPNSNMVFEVELLEVRKK